MRAQPSGNYVGWHSSDCRIDDVFLVGSFSSFGAPADGNARDTKPRDNTSFAESNGKAFNTDFVELELNHAY